MRMTGKIIMECLGNQIALFVPTDDDGVRGFTLTGQPGAQSILRWLVDDHNRRIDEKAARWEQKKDMFVTHYRMDQDQKKFWDQGWDGSWKSRSLPPLMTQAGQRLADEARRRRMSPAFAKQECSMCEGGRYIGLDRPAPGAF